ncbi:MAG: excinuclease ABC subunit UvrC [Lachnospiraceae bacterium]|nr:excinuclease ABC subunit UvrC [Lachnospiraceae bacterium]MBF1018656.1 excinuclease ABC subunit UvrC [Lachnospiraceae bacterium]
MSTDFKIKEELKKLPHKPGVYLMRDADDTIMYVGKAVDLHKRVQSYFRTRIVGRGPQIEQMVSLVARFEYIVTDSEMEALVLENNLIKENRPRYNTMLKDDKTYPFIKVTVSEEYPRILFSRLMKKDKARYFGPFPSADAVREAIELVNKLMGLRTCNRVLPRDIGKDRPCLNYHMGYCTAPCAAGKITKEEYGDRVEKAIDFLSGNYSAVIEDLTKKMEQASQEMRFEDAAKYRDRRNSVRVIEQKQKMTDADMEDRDIIALAKEEQDVVVQVFFVREGKIIGREHYYMKDQGVFDDEAGGSSAVLQNFVKQFYGGTPFVPRELLLQEKIPDQDMIEKWLSERRGSRVHLFVPERGTNKRLMELASQNASLILSQDKERLKREEGRTIGAVKEIAKLLDLPKLQRMEAFDISNISGFANVGSMVVFEGGKPKRSDYRKFRIQTVAGPDDYACMKEVIERRFTHGLRKQDSFSKFPDLLLMDGGRGQVNIALQVLRELNISVPVCGMVKDDNHRTRGLYYHNVELPIDTRSEGFQLITRIQDEAHRFAIEYHRSLRSKAQVHSTLDEIPGVGPARRKALMRHFASIEELREATPEKIAEVPEIPENQAKAIYEFFHKEAKTK